MKHKKWIGGALLAFGVYQMFFATITGAGFSGYQLISGAGGAGTSYSISDLPTMEGNMFYVDLALIAGGAYLIWK